MRRARVRRVRVRYRTGTVPDLLSIPPATIRIAYCLMSIHSLLGDLCDACGINLQLGNISRVQTRLGSKTETKSSEIFVEDY